MSHRLSTLPPLHRQASGFWQVSHSGVMLVRLSPGRWTAHPCTASARSWLGYHRLLGLECETRRDLLLIIAAHARHSPLPRGGADNVQLVRLNSGYYRTADGNWTVSRLTDGWEISHTSEPLTGWSPTLHFASERIAALQRRYAIIKPRPK